MPQSNLATAVEAVGRLTDDEARQIVGLLNVRLDGPAPTGNSRGKGAGRGSRTGKGARQGKGPGGKPKRKGNPQRKSQFSTHPVYLAYKEAQKAANLQQKEAQYKTVHFSELPMYEPYKEKLQAWIQAKCLFRGQGNAEEKVSSDKELHEKPPPEEAMVVAQGAGSDASTGQPDASSENPRKRLRASSPQAKPGFVPTGRYSNPPEGYPGTVEEFQLLNNSERKKVHWSAEQTKMDVETVPGE
jgi:hypothetical protein